MQNKDHYEQELKNKQKQIDALTMEVASLKKVTPFSQPNSDKANFVYNGEKKYPIDAIATTIPIAKPLVLFGKCLPTSPI